ncbi:MAG: DnaJ domain-containing protein [Burkholderiales bacterium]|nr:DnaJ domain-containing protein [Burkholderiales bacterium]
MKPMNTFYDTLQVSRSANDAALQAAFKTLCEKYHPDKDPGDLVGPRRRCCSSAKRMRCCRIRINGLPTTSRLPNASARCAPKKRPRPPKLPVPCSRPS